MLIDPLFSCEFLSLCFFCCFPFVMWKDFKTQKRFISTSKQCWKLVEIHNTLFYQIRINVLFQLSSLLGKKPDATMQEIEDVFDGNLCRCTGYRPIFDAFKSMASDASADLLAKVLFRNNSTRCQSYNTFYTLGQCKIKSLNCQLNDKEKFNMLGCSVLT